MKTYFRRNTCPNCRARYDCVEKECPSCHGQNPEFERSWPFEKHVRDIFPWQIGYFLFGWLGFQATGILIQLIVQLAYSIANPEATAEQIATYMGQVSVAFSINAVGYGIIFGVLVLILCLRKRMHVIVNSFKNWVPYVVGIGGGILLLGISIAYGVLSDAIFKAAGVTPSPNANETSIRAMATAYPALSIIIFGIIGPFCEEIGYRVGLFGLTSRLGRVWAYVVSAFVFAAIHFGWEVLGSGVRDDIIVELVNFPSYLIAGIGLCLLYDRVGFSASFLAHITNNLISVGVTIAQGGQA